MPELPYGWIGQKFALLNSFRSASIDPARSPDEMFELYSVPSFPTRKPELVRGAEIGSTKQLVSARDVLICKINPRINRVWSVAETGAVRQIASSEWIGFRAPEQCTGFYRYFYSSPAFREQLCTELTGVGGSLTRAQPKRVDDFIVPVAPLREQQRIADKLDTVLAGVDACRDRLARVAPLLKRFRQSVLAAAVAGRLTDEWRAQRHTAENGNDLVALDAVAKSTLLRQDAALAKKKSSANGSIDDSYTFQLPESWTFTSWGRLSEWITYGFTRPMPATSNGVKLLTAKNIHPFDIRTEGCAITSDVAFSALSEKDKPIPGDLLITKDGTIGRAALVTLREPFCINQSVAVCWLRSTAMNRRFLELVANADYTQRFVLEKAKGMAIQHLSITDFARCPVPVPPLTEQDEIVRRVETLFGFADRLESRLAQAQTVVDRLTPSLLAKAFRGELVPQDPEDEPAAELLKRLIARRATPPPKHSQGRRSQAA